MFFQNHSYDNDFGSKCFLRCILYILFQFEIINLGKSLGKTIMSYKVKIIRECQEGSF